MSKFTKEEKLALHIFEAIHYKGSKQGAGSHMSAIEIFNRINSNLFNSVEHLVKFLENNSLPDNRDSYNYRKFFVHKVDDEGTKKYNWNVVPSSITRKWVYLYIANNGGFIKKSLIPKKAKEFFLENAETSFADKYAIPKGKKTHALDQKFKNPTGSNLYKKKNQILFEELNYKGSKYIKLKRTINNEYFDFDIDIYFQDQINSQYKKNKKIMWTFSEIRHRSSTQQKNFRKRLFKTYSISCAFCDKKEKKILQASHICDVEFQALTKIGLNNVQNGIILCKNCHTLFDSMDIKIKNKKIENNTSLEINEELPIEYHKNINKINQFIHLKTKFKSLDKKTKKLIMKEKTNKNNKS